MANRSEININKETLEAEILKRTIFLSKTKKKLTRDILCLLDGEPIVRDKNDRPDIVIAKHDKQNPENDLLIGIEHFLVEQVSETKGQQRKSVIKEKQQYLKKSIAYRDEAQDAHNTELRRKISNTIFDMVASTNTSSIPDLRESFDYVYNKHCDNIPEYIRNLEKLAEGKQVRLAFLIEIHCYADDIYLNNGRTVERRHNGVYPVLNWMVEELEKLDPEIVQYVVLYFRNSINDDVEDVVAVETKDIRGSLRKQGIIVYDYCDDPCKIRFRKDDATETGFMYSTEVLNEDTFSDDLMPILQQAYKFKRQSIPFLAPRVVQAMMYAFGNVTFIQKGSTIKMKTNYLQSEVLDRYDHFLSLYPIQKDQDSSVNGSTVE